MDNDTYAGPVLSNLGDFCRVGFSRHRPVTGFIVPDVVWTDAVRDEIISSFMPYALSTVEQTAQHGVFMH
jgi:hypothetical protein